MFSLLFAAATLVHPLPPKKPAPTGDGLPAKAPSAVGMSAARLATIDRVIERGIRAGGYPGAAVVVGRKGAAVWEKGFGGLGWTREEGSVVPERTIYDLASLTKVIATTTLVMRAVDDGRLTVEDRVRDWLPEWRGSDRETVTVRDLLAHSSGLPAYLPFFRDHAGRIEFEPAISHIPLEYEPRSRSTYSDLGFILLGFILENARGASRQPGRFDPSLTLASQFRRVASFITTEPLTFNPPRTWRPRTAPTELETWR